VGCQHFNLKNLGSLKAPRTLGVYLGLYGDNFTFRLEKRQCIFLDYSNQASVKVTEAYMTAIVCTSMKVIVSIYYITVIHVCSRWFQNETSKRIRICFIVTED
jgi:hypothetical protein